MSVDNTQEIQCIFKAREYKLSVVKDYLEDLTRNGEKFENPLAGFGPGITWEEDRAKRFKQIMFLPVALMLTVVLVFSTPIGYISHLVEMRNKKNKAKEEILRLSEVPSEIVFPVEKNISALWDLQGLDGGEYTPDLKLQLIHEWLDILYGPGTADALNIEGHIQDIARGHAEANRSFYEGKGGPHILFVPPVETMIKEISKELSEYA